MLVLRHARQVVACLNLRAAAVPSASIRASAARSSAAAFTTMAAAADSEQATLFALDPFCRRQFDDPNNIAHISMPVAEFMAKFDAACRAQVAQSFDGNILCVCWADELLHPWSR